MSEKSRRALHVYALLLSFGVVGLIAAGGLVKSLEAGLSVPDWPTSYGGLNPPRWWEIQNVRAEHGHRLFAGTVALLTVGLAVMTAKVEPRSWVRKVAYAAVGTVFAQALLGGLTVRFFLPTPISVSHAAVAQLFLCLVVTCAVATSAPWASAGPWRPSVAFGEVRLLAVVTTVAIFVQILLGAVVRHTGSGLAIPDFPLAFGRLVPPEFTLQVSLHYFHRLGAVVASVLIIATVVKVWRTGRELRGLAAPALAMLGLVAVQIALGGAIVITERAVFPNTVHVAGGACLLATSLVLSLNCWAGFRRSAPVGRGETAASGSGGEDRGILVSAQGGSDGQVR